MPVAADDALQSRGTPFVGGSLLQGQVTPVSPGSLTPGTPKSNVGSHGIPSHWTTDGMLKPALHPKAHPAPALIAAQRTGVRLCNAHSDKNTSFFFFLHCLFFFFKFYLKVKKPSQHERLDKHSSFPQQKLQKCLWICFGKKQCFLWKSFIEKSQFGTYSSILHF